MLGSALIVFREVLEAALIVGIILGATRGVPRRGVWVSGGALVGVTGAVAVALFAGSIASVAEGFGQEIFNASILFIAVAMLAWHQVWMSRHGREMSEQMNDLGRSIKEGGTAMHVLAIVVGTAILREGSEAALFLYGVASTETGHSSQLLAGGLLGLVGGILCGGALYLGLLNIPSRLLFGVTGWLIMLLAAGMASQGAAFLVQANILPALGEPLWNSSAILARDSMVGRVMHTLVGYDDRPAGIQLVFYAITLFGILGLSRMIARRPGARKLGLTLR
jgi:high-affinity iron transporter